MWFGYMMHFPLILVVRCGSFLGWTLISCSRLTPPIVSMVIIERVCERGELTNVPNDCLFFIKLSCYCGDSILGELDESWIPAVTWSTTSPTHSHELGRLNFRKVPKVTTAQNTLAQEFPKFRMRTMSHHGLPMEKISRLNSGFGHMLWWKSYLCLGFCLFDEAFLRCVYYICPFRNSMFVDPGLFACLIHSSLRGRMAYLLANSCDACSRRATSHLTRKPIM